MASHSTSNVTTQEPGMITVSIRWMIRRDMEDVLRIEKQCFTTPWTEDEFLQCLRQRNCIGMIAEDPDGRIAGYMIYELHKRHLRLLNLAVASEFQRQGIGTQLLMKLRSKLKTHHRRRIALRVSERNLGAQLFFRDMGFLAVKVVPNEIVEGDDYLMVFNAVVAHQLEEAAR